MVVISTILLVSLLPYTPASHIDRCLLRHPGTASSLHTISLSLRSVGTRTQPPSELLEKRARQD